ncbi:hypothetical protein C7S18_16285 [Ahniella affigens]|uniref:Uncharacterized protein n=1 Tax=Ahniella affigens TaxID=2021234 RepID=A0A2P1PUY7_9GAMM|nr:hypothetical protein C7S18_16285 [Ahniella affigens]
MAGITRCAWGGGLSNLARSGDALQRFPTLPAVLTGAAFVGGRQAESALASALARSMFRQLVQPENASQIVVCRFAAGANRNGLAADAGFAHRQAEAIEPVLTAEAAIALRAFPQSAFNDATTADRQGRELLLHECAVFGECAEIAGTPLPGRRVQSQLALDRLECGVAKIK